MLVTTYACVAATAQGARCRNQAKGKYHVCGTPHTQDSPVAPPPDIIFLKFRINEKWAEQLVAAGLRIVERSAQKAAALEAQHASEAEAVRRKSDTFRPTPDSGVPVFGKDGAKNISLLGLWAELAGEGYAPIQAHVLKSAGQNGGYSMLTLVVEMSHGGQHGVSPSVMPILGDLLAKTWGFAHIWANPPKTNDGKVVHTVNLSHRADTPAAGRLQFFSGLWRIA